MPECHEMIAKLLTAGLLLGGVLTGCTTAPARPPAAAAPVPGVQSEQTFTTQIRRDVRLQYLLYLPKDYATDPTARFPLILFLHGAGERGTDVRKVAVHGPPKRIAAGQSLPCIVVSPQCPEGQVWDDEALLRLLSELKSSLRVDPARVHVTGLSMGGFGTWALISRHPELFASAAPICGGGDRIRPLLFTAAQREALRTLPIRVYHGGKDTVVPLVESERMVEQFKRAGAVDIQLKVYPEAGHDSWTATYEDPGFFPWMLAQHR